MEELVLELLSDFIERLEKGSCPWELSTCLMEELVLELLSDFIERLKKGKLTMGALYLPDRGVGPEAPVGLYREIGEWELAMSSLLA
jgi:hypothetical protein